MSRCMLVLLGRRTRWWRQRSRVRWWNVKHTHQRQWWRHV